MTEKASTDAKRAKYRIEVRAGWLAADGMVLLLTPEDVNCMRPIGLICILRFEKVIRGFFFPWVRVKNEVKV